MNNKLPKVYVNEKQKIESNNQKVFYSKKKDLIRFEEEKNFASELIVRKKVNQILSSPKFVYKIKVKILTSTGEKEETIIAKEKDTLLTSDNKYIPISSIKNIELI